MNEDEIFAEIGRALLGDEFGSVRLSDAEAARAGRSWFESVLPTLRSRICGNPAIDQLILGDTAKARNAALVAAIQAALANEFKGIPILAVAYAVLLYGIHKLCDGYSTGGSPG